MHTIQEFVDHKKDEFSKLSKSRKRALWREARAYINRVPHMADASTFWRGLSARQVLASH